MQAVKAIKNYMYILEVTDLTLGQFTHSKQTNSVAFSPQANYTD
jgi:hypothetical protein